MPDRHRRAAVRSAAVLAVITVTSTGAVTAARANSVPTLTSASSAASGAATASAHVRSNSGVHLHDSHGITVRRVQRIGSRQLQVTIVPAALRRPIGVRIILPVGYRGSARHRYPSLYLFPGTSGHSDDWSTVGQAPRTTRPYRLITISSDIGFNGDGGSWFSNWVDRKTSLGPSQWERYDIHELIPWIDANLDTIRARSGRAVAGLSQGGYGATELAARHPDLFTEAGSFSGAPEIDRDADVRAGAASVIDATMVGLNGVEPNAPFGDHVTDEINWQGHDPARLVRNLRGIGLWLATADGEPGKYDDPVTNPEGVAAGGTIESMTHISTDRFHAHLVAAHIPSTVYDYGKGTHSWPYWARDLRRFVKPLMHRFAHPPRVRSAVHYKSIQPRWAEWGWRVRFHRAHRLEFSTLSRVRRTGLRLKGSGRAVVVTPGRYSPGKTYRVKVARATPRRITANHHGRLRIPVALGPTVRRVAVRIAV